MAALALDHPRRLEFHARLGHARRLIMIRRLIIHVVWSSTPLVVTPVWSSIIQRAVLDLEDALHALRRRAREEDVAVRERVSHGIARRGPLQAVLCGCGSYVL